ncbi:distal tail protein Dit [Clostridium perfringens]|uniref:Phage tail component protein n=1 Tax=Clostridium perfringens TaxID=1502 RepID=A0A133MP71_CLOPF|nr:distal tail protein Dit [Clostridium perfringens]KXA05848.1 phage tail component protein [Clostridium perfringens]
MNLNTLIFNNKDSLKDLGIGVASLPSIPFSLEDIKEYKIQGRNGSLIRKYGTYQDRKIVFDLVVINYSDSAKAYNTISKWIYEIKDNKLFYDKEDVYFKVKNISIDGLQKQAFYGEGLFKVTFIVEPFLYYKENQEIEITSNTKIVSPEFAYDGVPEITVLGTGDITLSINDKRIVLNKIEECITINSSILECYKEKENLNYKMSGEFPILKNGENTINIEGNIKNIKIKPNWRCL